VQGCVKKVGDKIIYYAPVLIGIGIAVAMIEVDFFLISFLHSVRYYH